MGSDVRRESLPNWQSWLGSNRPRERLAAPDTPTPAKHGWSIAEGSRSYPPTCVCLVASREVRKYLVVEGVIGHAKDCAGSCGVSWANRACVRPEGRDRGGECEMGGFLQQRRFRRRRIALHRRRNRVPTGCWHDEGQIAIEAMWKGAAEQVGDPKFITLE